MQTGRFKTLHQNITRKCIDPLSVKIRDAYLRISQKGRVKQVVYWAFEPRSTLVLDRFMIRFGIGRNGRSWDGPVHDREDYGFLELLSGLRLPCFWPCFSAMHPKNFLWVSFRDFDTQKSIFEYSKRNIKAIENVEWLICNTALDLEPGALSFVPQILPIGPLSATNQLEPLTGSFWHEDETSLEWLDQQPPGSVIYVAFGSYTIFDPIQFQELALGLELSNRPFLWVVREDMTEGSQCEELYPEGFKTRVGSRGKMVGWAPQRSVLSHPSIACFISHCGWNSTVEGVSNGVPFLCWPYFADQFINETYICEFWKIGLSFKRDEREIITREEITSKVDQLLTDESFKEAALKLKGLVLNSVNETGISNRNFNNFIEWMNS